MKLRQILIKIIFLQIQQQLNFEKLFSGLNLILITHLYK